MTDSQSPESGLDLSYLNDISGGSAEFMIEMIDIFLEQTPLYFNDMATAIGQKDWVVVANVAHKIKPTLAFMGRDDAKDDMQKLEHSARNQEGLDRIEPEFLRLQALCHDLFGKLASYKKELQAQL
jgi:HPt (histidine-containing phosphotransfer) domain-containing protein